MTDRRLPRIFCCLFLASGLQLIFAEDLVGGTHPFSDEPVSPTIPWIQYGNAFVQEYQIPLALAKQCVPSEFKVVETRAGSGVTIGSLYIAKYDNRSSVEYSELIFICATVEYKGQKGKWVSSIYVDNKIAQKAGIEVWGLPKQLATFQWTQSPSSGVERVVVTDQQAPDITVLDASFHDRSPIIPSMHQTVRTFSVINQSTLTSTILLSDTEQKYGVKPLEKKSNVYNVSSQSPLHDYMTESKESFSVEMSDGLFNMTAPRKIPSSARKNI